MVDLRSIWGHVGALAWVAFRSFAGTLSLFVVVGLILGSISYVCLKEYGSYAWTLAVVVMVESVVIGLFLAGKRAILLAIATGVGRAQLGGEVLRLCMNNLLNVSQDGSFGERGSRAAVAVERLPLAQVEQRLARVVEEFTSCSISSGRFTKWFWQTLHRRLLRVVQAVTMAQFREQESKEGGVDLVKVQSELGPKIDKLVIIKLTQGFNRWTAALFVALILLVFAQIYICQRVWN
jgi:hypothetical protein